MSRRFYLAAPRHDTEPRWCFVPLMNPSVSGHKRHSAAGANAALFLAHDSQRNGRSMSTSGYTFVSAICTFSETMWSNPAFERVRSTGFKMEQKLAWLEICPSATLFPRLFHILRLYDCLLDRNLHSWHESFTLTCKNALNAYVFCDGFRILRGRGGSIVMFNYACHTRTISNTQPISPACTCGTRMHRMYTLVTL
jgi:hypothetical protein